MSNKGKPIGQQQVQIAYIRPKYWWQRPTYRLLQPLYFRNIIVPRGFITDMGTIPRWVWFLFDPINQYPHAVIVHDYALGIMARSLADARFREVLRALNIPEWRVQVLYRSVSGYSRYLKVRARLLAWAKKSAIVQSKCKPLIK